MKIAMIGCGNMGGAIAEKLSASNQLFLHDHDDAKAAALSQKGFGKACHDLNTAISNAETVILAVKPQNLQESANALKACLTNGQMVISILAGIPIAVLQQFFQNHTVVRMMPNLAVAYGEGVIGLSAAAELPKQELESLTNLFKPLGKVYWLPEDKIDALSALAGSGPAFIFAIVEAMVDAGISMGFTASDAQSLVYQTIKGSLTLLEKTGKHPAELKWQVTSPGGTTIAGLRKFEEGAVRAHLINTFVATYERARELAASVGRKP